MLILTLIIFQLTIFSLLIFIFKKVMTKNVISATQHLDELSKEYQRRQYEVEEKIKQLEEQSKITIAQAQAEAEQLKAQIIQEAKEQYDKIIEEARIQSQEIIQQAEHTRQVLISEIEERINKEAIQKACELIRDTLPEEFKKAVHNYWLEELLREGFVEIRRLNIPEDIKEIDAISAFPLNDVHKKEIIKKLKELLGREFDLREKIDPSIVAGIVINIGSLVLDGSLRFKIKESVQKR